MSDERDPLGILGKTLEGKYRLESLAGLGGFSAVYRAQHLVWNEPVAIKFFTMLEDAEPEQREQLLQDFIQEGKLMSQLSSRSAAIVQARDMGKLKIRDDGEWIPYMVLEWLDGTPLDQVISRERKAGLPVRSLSDAMTLLEPAAIALDIAHRGNVAHRDLKPANFVVSGDPRDPEAGLKVLDFGIAKVMESQIALQEQMQLTGKQITAFTPNYGAPEQFSRNFGATGPWTDVFAMALILLELLQGKRVLDGESFFELGVASCDEERRPTPRALGIEVSDKVEAVFAEALTVNPESRFPDMRSFWKALHRCTFVGADTWSPRTNRPSQRNLQDELTENPPLVVIPSDPRSGPPSRSDTVSAVTFGQTRGARRKPILWAAAGVALASLAVLAVTISTRSPAPAPNMNGPATLPAATQAQPVAPPATADSAVEPGDQGARAPDASATPASSGEPSSKPRIADKAAPPRPTPPSEPATKDEKKPKGQPRSGGDAWDPSSFGGRR